MAEQTEISWCDATFNPWIGCTKVAPGCTHCYAESFATRYGKAKWGPNGTRVMTSANYWKQPIKWNQAAAYAAINHADETNLGKDLGPYHRPRVFCASLADVFEDWAGDIHDHKGNRVWVDRATGTDWQTESPQWSFSHHRPARLDDLRRKLFALIDATPNLDWMLLTKRPENIIRMWPRGGLYNSTLPIKNVWLGTTVTDQKTECENVNTLVNCSNLASVIFLSIEPLLGPVTVQQRFLSLGKRAFVITGGESGHGARPMNPQWVRDIRDQCVSAGVSFHHKQNGEYAPIYTNNVQSTVWCYNRSPDPDNPGTCTCDDCEHVWRVGKKAAGRLLDGRTWDEFPEATPCHP